MVVVALKQGEETCGKRVSDSKKKFYWQFRQDSTQYRLELICSFLTGKKKVLLNGDEIHSQKNIFNVNFEFVHVLGQDSIRISQNKQQFECRINNRPFADLMEDRLSDPNLHSEQAPSTAVKNDPFAEFAFASNKASGEQVPTADPFGQFDNAFTYEKKTQKPAAEPQKPADSIENKENELPNDFSQKFKEFDKGFSAEVSFATGNYQEVSKHAVIGSGNTPSDIFFEADLTKDQKVDCQKSPTFLDKMSKLFTRKQPIDLL